MFFEIAAGTSKGGADDGRLLMTPEGFTFIGDTRREMAWEDVYHLATGDADFRRDDTVWYLAVQRHGRQSSSKFWFSNSAAAQQAYLVAEAFVRGVSPSSARAVPDPFTTDVVGESYRQDALVALAPTLGSDREFVAALVPEPTNPHDGNAVKVCIAATDEHVGYLSRVLASRLHDRITERHREAPVHVHARLTGGGINTPTHGVQLDLGNLMEPSDAALNEE